MKMILGILISITFFSILNLSAQNVMAQETDVFNLLASLKRSRPTISQSVQTRNATENFFTQKLDHFNLLDQQTWQQRYFVSNETYVPGGPVFLYLAGEWKAHPSEVTDTFIGDLADQHGALLIDLEHRYYGQSRPVSDTSVPNLKYLNTDQALEDTAMFTLAMKESSEYNITGPWVVIGASYSAQLSAWARAKYPHLYFAAISSSAPVYAQLDIPEYFEVVGEALEATSPVCPGVISSAMDQLLELVEQGDAPKITNIFNLCFEVDLSVPENMMSVYLYTALVFAYQVQYARDGNLALMCSILEEGIDQPLETVAVIVQTAYSPSCLVPSAQAILQYFKNDTQWSDVVLHQFYYQMCIEYGHYMSLSSPNQPFGQVVPVEFFLLWCPNVYGPEFDRELNEVGISRTNLIHGGRVPDVSRVIYTHGSLDPWHTFGILQQLGPDTPVIIIEGESHCRDLDAPSISDSQQLQDARDQISRILSEWLQLA